jgi:hypothetical protein
VAVAALGKTQQLSYTPFSLGVELVLLWDGGTWDRCVPVVVDQHSDVIHRHGVHITQQQLSRSRCKYKIPSAQEKPCAVSVR